MMRSVSSRSRTAPALAATLAAAAVLTALASPAEARRRGHHARAGGGYNPPYAAMVVDVKSGRTLHAVNEDALRHPASGRAATAHEVTRVTFAPLSPAEIARYVAHAMRAGYELPWTVSRLVGLPPAALCKNQYVAQQQSSPSKRGMPILPTPKKTEPIRMT